MKKIISFFQWLLFVVIIPLMVLVVVAGTVLHLSGVDVLGKAKEVVSVLDDSDQIEKLQKTLDKTKESLSQKDSTEKELQSKIEEKESEIESKQKEIESLQAQLKEFEEGQKIQEGIRKSFESMSPKNAAEILSGLESNQAISILRGVSPAALAQILENMEVENAVRLTKGITQ